MTSPRVCKLCGMLRWYTLTKEQRPAIRYKGGFTGCFHRWSD